MARRPVIGITSYVERARWGVWDTKAALVPHAYVRQVEDAGGRAVVVPPTPYPADDPLAGRLDGLLLAGGADVDPARYGESAHHETGGLRPERDAAELALLGAALDADLPVLGVCRGMQLMAVHAGGRLVQHLPEVVGHERHRPELGVYGDHAVRLAPGTLAHALLGDQLPVRSYHHQGVADPGRLTASGYGDDGTIEVLEDGVRRFAIGVLWHPEVGDDARLFRALVDAARGITAA